MTDAEARPPDSPTPDDLRDAVTKGLGRALAWARAGFLADIELLREACLTDMRYDRQINDERGAWLWDIIESAGARDALRGDVLSAVTSPADDAPFGQLCLLASRYALTGDEDFRWSIRAALFRRDDEAGVMAAEEAWVEVAGLPGLAEAAGLRGESLIQRPWDWTDSRVADRAEELFGSRAVEDALREAAGSIPDVARYRDGWLAAKADDSPEARKAARPTPEERDSFAGLMRRIEASGGRYVPLRGWCDDASGDELEAVAERAVSSRMPGKLVHLLRILRFRPQPRFDPRLLGLLDHDDEGVRRAAFSAVAACRDPAIRQYALSRLPDIWSEPDVLGLFARNAESGDGSLILRRLLAPEAADLRHSFGRHLRALCEREQPFPIAPLALWGYRHTPCGLCRAHFVELLIGLDAAPAWLLDECRHDSEAETRRLVTQEAS